MLTDSSLTNILVVSGVSQIRYRVYNQHVNRTNLVNYLKKLPNHDFSHDTLMRAYTDMISLSIPAAWRISSELVTEPEADMVLELWVFWFDERHTGKIDANDNLYKLEEIKVGSFTWENAYSKIQSPTASPLASSAQSNSSVPVAVSEEYKMFIKSIRNLINVQIKRKGALPLGEFYLFPSSDQDVTEEEGSTPSTLLKSTSSMLCCSYNIYLASTNLIFQPNTRRMRIKPITHQTIRSKGKKVILCPSGETVFIASNSPTLPQSTEEEILKNWSLLLDIPYNYLIQSQPLSPTNNNQTQSPLPQQKNLPNLVAIKGSVGEETFYYPTSLVFLSSSSKLSPTAMAGMNGLFGFNQGYTEDLGDKWNRWAWSDNISNCWDYVCPREATTAAVLDALAQDNGSSNTNGSLLQKAISEPVIASPLMATKSVATRTSVTGSSNQRNNPIDTTTTATPVSSIEDTDDLQNMQPQPSLMRNRSRYQANLSLVDFAMANFFIPSNNLDDLPEYPNAIQHSSSVPTTSHSGVLEQTQQTVQSLSTSQHHQSGSIEQMNLSLPNGENGLDTSTMNTTNDISTSRSPQVPNLELDAFRMVDDITVDSMVLDMPNRWTDSGMDDLDSFDLDVTDADFDFFHNDKEIVSLDQKQQQHILDTDMNSVVHDMSVTPLQVGMAPDDSFVAPIAFELNELKHIAPQHPPQTQEQEVSLQQQFVPSQFAPVRTEMKVNDAKYYGRGKFTYSPLNPDRPRNRKKRSTDYRPDYVPTLCVSKKSPGRRKSSKLLLDTIKKENEPTDDRKIVDTAQEAHDFTTTNSVEHLAPSTMETDMTTINSSDESSSSYTSTDEEDDGDDCSDAGKFNMEDETSKIDRALNSTENAQEKLINKIASLLSGSTMLRKKASVDTMIMDYDSPFARAVASSVIRLGKSEFGLNGKENSQEMLVALDYLCQQAVIGGYPFSGGIESMSSNGFEANEGESAKAIVARRRNLLQKFNGDTIHIPSTPNDIDFMTQNFKTVLDDIFNQKKSPDIDEMCIDMPLPSSVTVKGPLNVQQYYDLSETNQTHSKYGKYQVKKRRPAEPNLDTLQPPTIIVNRREDNLEGSPQLIMFWEKLRLEPYSSEKHINYFVIYPKNEHIEGSITHFFKGLSTMYETCQLGNHYPGNINVYRKGLAPVPLLSQLDGESFEDRQMRSYITECQSLGSTLGSASPENVHTVIYIVNPASDLSSNLDMSHCFSKLVNAYHTTSAINNSMSTEKRRPRLVMQLVPIEHVLRSTSFGGCIKFGLKEIAFSVYSKCLSIVNRHHSRSRFQDSQPIIELYGPPFVLAKPLPSTISFSMKNAISTFPTILESHAVLHLGYSFSFDERWMIIVWTDNQGELVEFAILDCSHENMFEEAWTRTKEISKRAGFAWTFVIAKMGLLFEDELKSWIECISEKENVAIVSLDIESTLYVTPTQDTMNDTPLNSMVDSSGNVGTPTSGMMNAAATVAGLGGHGKKMYDGEPLGQGYAKALLLNHRVAYSSKRERMSHGVLGVDPKSEQEEWMIPLASGYMIHTLPTTENPNKELFNCNPLVLEIHLIYNQTNHSAYSTLRDITKKYHDLSYVNVMPSNSNCFPIHLALVERLSRILLIISS